MSQSDLVPPEVSSRSAGHQSIHAHYFPYVDGLRCLAILPVFANHLSPILCPAGFLGVDIFFVISGYLICSGIFRDLKEGNFSISKFYFRRIRRILPAYFTVVLCVLLAGVLLYHWGRLLPLAQTALSSTFFATNVYFWLDMGYFQPNAHENPLLHLWSLGVEEQFYIGVPLACLLMWKRCPARILGLFSSAFALSFFLCIVLGKFGQSTTAFYVLPSRAWELLAGALIAIVPKPRGIVRYSWLSWFGLGLILVSFYCLTTERTFTQGGTSVEIVIPCLGSLGVAPFPGLITLPVIVGSVLLLWFGNEGVLGRILRLQPIVGIGKISYSLYLWHWPVIVFADYITYDQRTISVSAIIVAISFSAAWISWRWIEMPARLSGRFRPHQAFIFALAGCVLLAALSTVLVSTEGLRHIIHMQANANAQPPRPFMPNFEKLRRRPDFEPPSFPGIDANYTRVLGVRNRPLSFCLIGDSHAADAAVGLDHAATANGQSGIFIDVSMAPYVGRPDSSRFLEWIASRPDIGNIYLVCRWLRQYDVYDGLPGFGDKGRMAPVVLSAKLSAEIEANFRCTAQWFAEKGKRTFVFSCTPEYRYCPNDILARSLIVPFHFPIEITAQDYRNRQAPITAILAKLEGEGLITVVPWHSALIAGPVSVFTTRKGAPMYRDGNHLTPDGSCSAAEAVAPMLWENGFVRSQR